MSHLSVGSLPFGAYSLTRVTATMYGVRVLRLARGTSKLQVDTLLTATLPSEAEARAYVAALEAGDPVFAADCE